MIDEPSESESFHPIDPQRSGEPLQGGAADSQLETPFDGQGLLFGPSSEEGMTSLEGPPRLTPPVNQSAESLLETVRSFVNNYKHTEYSVSSIETRQLRASVVIASVDAKDYWQQRLSVTAPWICIARPAELAHLLRTLFDHGYDPNWYTHLEKLRKEAKGRLWDRLFQSRHRDALERLACAEKAATLAKTKLRGVVLDIDHLTGLGVEGQFPNESLRKRRFQVPILGLATAFDGLLSTDRQYRLEKRRDLQADAWDVQQALLDISIISERFEDEVNSRGVFAWLPSKIIPAVDSNPIHIQSPVRVLDAFYRVVRRDGVEIVDDSLAR